MITIPIKVYGALQQKHRDLEKRFQALEESHERLRVAIRYYFDVLEEVRGKDWDKSPDHVVSKMIEAINQAPTKK